MTVYAHPRRVTRDGQGSRALGYAEADAARVGAAELGKELLRAQLIDEAIDFDKELAALEAAEAELCAQAEDEVQAEAMAKLSPDERGYLSRSGGDA